MDQVIAPRPKTVAEILALPEGPSFGAEDRVIDGRTVRVPIMRPIAVVPWGSDDDIVHCFDADGVAWKLGIYADGTWFKRRCN